MPQPYIYRPDPMPQQQQPSVIPSLGSAVAFLPPPYNAILAAFPSAGFPQSVRPSIAAALSGPSTCQTIVAVYNGSPVSPTNAIPLSNSVGPNQRGVTFAIPPPPPPAAGWQTGTWELIGTGAGGRAGATNSIMTNISGGDTIVLSSFTPSGAFDQTGTASGTQVANANANASLAVLLIFADGANDGTQSESITGFTLTLCASASQVPPPFVPYLPQSPYALGPWVAPQLAPMIAAIIAGSVVGTGGTDIYGPKPAGPGHVGAASAFVGPSIG